MFGKKNYSERYFEGYTSKESLDDAGKRVKTVRTYEGDVYELDAPDRAVILKKLLYGILLALFFACCVGSSVLDGRGAGTKVSAGSCFICLMVGCYGIKAVIDFVISHKKLTRFEYEEFRKEIKLSSIILMVTSGVMTVIYAYYAVISAADGAKVKTELGAAALGLMCIVCAFAMFYIEKISVYRVTKGTYKHEVKQKRSMKINTQSDGIPELNEEDSRYLF